MKKIFFGFILSALLSASVFAQTYNYAPNMANIPCLKQKGDAIVGVGWGRGIVFQALELQASYAVTPHLAVMANYFGPREKNVRNRSEVGTDFFLLEAAIGAYESLPKGSASIFTGMSTGNMLSNFNSERTAKFTLQRWFIQPGINYRSNFFQAGVALRITHLTYRKGIVSYAIDEPYLQYIKNIEENAPLFLPELGLQVGMRIKPITISLNLAAIFPDTDRWNFNRLNSGLSMAVDFGVRRKKI